MSLLTASPRPRHGFHNLTVREVEPLTEGAVAITLDVPRHLEEVFLGYHAGQHLTVRADIDGESVRQSYSICQSPERSRATGSLRIGVARVPGGRMSTYLNERVKPGDTLSVMPPLGSFVVPTDPGSARHHLMIAAGSGITPILAHVEHILAVEPASRVTMFVGNATDATIMFAERLGDLKDRYVDRLQLVHVLSRQDQEVELLSGRIDGDRLPRLLEAFAPAAQVDEAYLCGPYEMVRTAREVLTDAGLAPGQLHDEVFHVPGQEPTGVGAAPAAGTPGALTGTPAARGESASGEVEPGSDLPRLRFTLDGRTSSVTMARRDESLLQATLRVHPDAPYSCTGGVCGTCRARVVGGQVRMDRNFALDDDEVAAGMVLACQSHPDSDEVVLTFDV